MSLQAQKLLDGSHQLRISSHHVGGGHGGGIYCSEASGLVMVLQHLKVASSALEMKPITKYHYPIIITKFKAITHYQASKVAISSAYQIKAITKSAILVPTPTNSFLV